MKQILVTLMIGTLAAACAKQETAQNPAAPATAASQPATAVAASNAAPPAVANESAAPAPAAAKLAGTIVETMDSGGYTYMKLKTAQGEQWVATPQAQVKKGQLVSVVSQMTAEKFQSSTLKRTFDRIVFGTLEAPGAPAAQPAQTAAATSPNMPPTMPPNMASAMGSPADHMKARADIGDVKVPKAEGGKTVAEVWAGRAALAEKEVVVRGKVVKFLGGIMGTNFLHVRDGSGSEANGDHDLTVTTSEMASVGDVVTIRGVVHVDKDFGAGYRYPVIVEKASIQK
ncbi:MAG TPA: OB-fold nucleic acid binding domain-containing protein [Thermoanaerobaculia bacterium]|nr:OB-fold nucleic acid binding domain-containing protein [Thermoanaerobaculia bacterium]